MHMTTRHNSSIQSSVILMIALVDIAYLRKCIRATPCFLNFLFVDFKINFSKIKINFSKIKVDFSKINVDKYKI